MFEEYDMSQDPSNLPPQIQQRLLRLQQLQQSLQGVMGQKQQLEMQLTEVEQAVDNTEQQAQVDASEQKAEAKVISEAKEKLSEVIPTPPEPTPVASAQALKDRLQWGEPGLTIIDARDRQAYLAERITGSMLIDDVSNLPENRDIYVYGDSDQRTEEVANDLRQQGFKTISQIQGGLAGWKAINGATEGRAA